MPLCTLLHLPYDHVLPLAGIDMVIWAQWITPAQLGSKHSVSSELNKIVFFDKETKLYILRLNTSHNQIDLSVVKAHS